MFKHLIFDLDGTIIDTLSSISISVNKTLKKFNQNYSYPKEVVKTFIGHGTPYLVTKALKDKNVDKEAFAKEYIQIQIGVHLKHATIFKGLYDVLLKAKELGCSLYVATNKPDEIAPKVINKLYGKGFFKEINAQKKNTPKKPDPYVVNKIINKYHLKRSECLYIGDSLVDILTAKNSKMKSCLVLYGYDDYAKIDLKSANFTIKKPQELLEIIK